MSIDMMVSVKPAISDLPGSIPLAPSMLLPKGPEAVTSQLHSSAKKAQAEKPKKISLGDARGLQAGQQQPVAQTVIAQQQTLQQPLLEPPPQTDDAVNTIVDLVRSKVAGQVDFMIRHPHHGGGRLNRTSRFRDQHPEAPSSAVCRRC